MPPVEEEAIFISPLVVEFPVHVLPDVVISSNLPVVTESVTRYKPVPEVMAVASKTKPDVAVVPVATLEVKV